MVDGGKMARVTRGYTAWGSIHVGPTGVPKSLLQGPSEYHMPTRPFALARVSKN